MVHTLQVQRNRTLPKHVPNRCLRKYTKTANTGAKHRGFQTLGNHEFDDQIQGLVPFMKAIKAPFVVSNLDDSEAPDLKGLYKKSIVIERGGKRIGIVGCITVTTSVR